MNINTYAWRIRAALGVGVLAVLLLATLALPSVAAAQAPNAPRPVTLALAGPKDVPLGNLARIVAVLQDGSGKPIAGATIVFTSPGTFAGAVGEMPIGEALTDEQGKAVLDYRLTIEGQNQVIARFYGDGSYMPAEASTTIVAAGRVQLVERTPSVRVPVLGSWTLMVLLGSVWLAYLLAVLLVAGIPRGGKAPSRPETGGEL